MGSVIQGTFPQGLQRVAQQVQRHATPLQPRMAGPQAPSRCPACANTAQPRMANGRPAAAHVAVQLRARQTPGAAAAQPKAALRHNHPVAQPHAAPGVHQRSPIQRHANGNAVQLPPEMVNARRGAGQPIPQVIRQKMESFFGANFSDVRIHVGPEATAIGALAFTQGTDIHFAPGHYNPATPQGQQILGHELTHVLQQRSGRVRNPFGSGVAVVQDHAMEAEAERMGHRAAAHQQGR
jgi:hypothetical protein